MKDIIQQQGNTVKTIFKYAGFTYQHIYNLRHTIPIVQENKRTLALIVANFLEIFLKQCKRIKVPVPRPVLRIFQRLNGQKKQTQNQPTSYFSSSILVNYFNNYEKQKLYLDDVNRKVASKESYTLDFKDIEQKMLEQFKKDNCLGCLASFTEEEPIPETSQLFSLVKANPINSILEDDIKKKACALLNCGGGYLLLGQNVNKLKVKGLKLGQQQRNKLHSFVYKTLKQRLFPNNFQLQISSVRMQTLNNKKSKDAQGQKSLIIRVALSPNTQSSLYFVQKKLPNYPGLYSCYFLNTEAVGSVNDVCILQNAEDIYKIIIKHQSMVRFQPKDKIVHTNLCISRKKNMQRVIECLGFQNPGERISLQKITIQQPIVKHRNQSIIIFSNQAQDYFIKIFKEALDSKKMYQVTFSKSYDFCRSNSIKSIWFVSHYYDLPVLQQIMNDVYTSNKKLIIITCTKYLKILQSQLSCLQHYKSTFETYFEYTPRMIKVPIDKTYGEQKYDIFIALKTFQQSYFSFKLLDDNRVKVKFIKQNNFKIASNTGSQVN